MCALTTGALLRNPLASLGQDRAGANPALDFPIPYEATTSPVFYFTRTTFEPYLGGAFFAQGADGKQVRLLLVAIRDYTPGTGTRLTTKPHRRTDSFSLHFRSAAPLRQTTATHTLAHDALGSFDLFMTQAEEQNAWLYEAVINHPVH